MGWRRRAIAPTLTKDKVTQKKILILFSYLDLISSALYGSIYWDRSEELRIA
ncbi:hypothetical protein H6F70_00035 [Coleofasciculus sp. FACHB-T130]|nr:hypothetical protein [Coleofasciculus sp. FACHB-T130]